MSLTLIEQMMRRELSIIGCFMSYSAPFPGHEWHDTIQSLLDGSLDMETMIAHRFSLSETPEIFAKLGAHEMPHLKIMLNPEVKHIMTLRNPRPWIECAQQAGFAVGAFNANTMEQVQAIVQAAQLESAPVIIQVSHNALLYAGSGNATLGLQYMAAIGRIAAQSVAVPVALHLDHATELEVLQAIALGFTSVMFDGDGLAFEDNVAITKRLCEIAHANDVCMEAEIGEVPKPGDEELDESTIALTDPDEALRFVNATEIDLLAIALGSVHGIKDKHISLDLDRLKSIREQVDTPLVLHGSSGVTDDNIARGIAMGLCKVNVATQSNQAFTRDVRGVLANDNEVVDPRKYLGPGRAAQIDAVRERIRFVGASGKADLVRG